MKNSSVLLFVFLVATAALLFGVVLPAMFSSDNTVVVFGGFGVVFALVTGALMFINAKFFQKRK